MAVGFKENSSEYFFRSLFIFSIAYLYEFINLYTIGNNKMYSFQKNISTIGFIFYAILSSIALLGLMKCFKIDNSYIMNESNFNLFKFKFKIDYFTNISLCIIMPIEGIMFFNRYDRMKNIERRKKEYEL
jgi:hypothetical protein